ncbi:MAG: excinuclease ABC subunit UvrC [Nitrospirae bacterium]|nr:MAG: excinuclease ABC subunit UvrC [Nitrospirota bacterium]
MHPSMSSALQDQPSMPSQLETKLSGLPRTPGVYLLKDREGEILYIGKAAVLADRVRSYFQKHADASPKIRSLTALVSDIEVLVTQSELEALILESNLIKRHQPRFNVVLRDDKHYPYLRLPIHDEFPRLSIVRRVKPDNALYFGPYVPVGAMRETLKIIRKAFPLATCTIDIDGKADRACLEFEIHRCLAPCTGQQSKAAYHQIVQQVRLFLEGRDQELLEHLRRDMHIAADQERFEEAARLRDRIASIEKTLETQRVAQIGPIDQDVVGVARSGAAADVQLLFVRGGLLIGRQDFFWSNAQEVSDEELIRCTIEQFYNKAVVPPKEILVPAAVSDSTLISAWLTEKKGERVRLLVPERGAKRRLLQMARDNAAAALANHHRSQQQGEQAMDALRQWLHLSHIPRRIEGFDISNTMGSHSVASMVVWEDGRMKRSEYRQFKIQTVEGSNDFASMREVVRRRYGGSLSPGEKKGLPYPDVILIDGGLGQVHAAIESINQLGLTRVAVFGIAKARGQQTDERIIVPGQEAPLVLPAHSPATHVIQLIRDEAHRFALRYHRRLRGNALIPLRSARARAQRS